MEIAIEHSIELRFAEGTPHAVEHLLLTPRSGPTQTVKSWSVEVMGMDRAASFTDPFGNIAHLVNQTPPPEVLVLKISGRVLTNDGTGVVGKLPDDPQAALFMRVTPDTKSPATMHGKFRHAESGGVARLDILHGLMARVHEHFAEDKAAEPADYAHSFIAAARALGIPARYVSGYMADAASGEVGTHAWAEAYTVGLGWIAFDATLDVCPTNRHVRVAVGLDAASTLGVRAHPEPEEEVHDETDPAQLAGITQSQQMKGSGQSQSQG